MRKSFCKTLSLVLTAALALGMTVSGTADAKGAVKLSKTKLKIKVGEKKTIKVKNSKKKAKWTIKSGKKYITLSKKKKASVVVKGKKPGKATVQAKVAGKKLKCKVTVQKKSTEKKNSTPTPTSSTDSGVKATPTPSPSASSSSDNSTPSPNPPQDIVPGEDLEIDLSGLTTTFTTLGTIDFSSQIADNFDLSLFSRLEIGYKLDFEGGDTSGFALGKIALAQTKDVLDGHSDGVAHNLNAMTVGSTSGSIDLTGASGKAVGINIQAMGGSDVEYAWPSNLTVTITSIKFIARTEQAGPTYPPEEFAYEGLDAKWIEDNIDSSKPMVAFTFDDGPVGNADTDTSMIIQNALAAHNAHATFFYIGSQINSDAKKKEISSAKEKGFEIGNHSWGWDSIAELDEAGIKESIEKTNAKLKEITGFDNFLFRPPYLAVSAAMKGYIKAPFAMSGTDSQDWNNATKEQIIENVKKAKDGDIVLMHETQKNTAAAIEELLDYMDTAGIQVVSVSEMFYAKGKKLMTGTPYSNA